MATNQMNSENIFRSIYDVPSNSIAILDKSNLIPTEYDTLGLSYIASGNGAGQIGTVTYFSNTVLVATLTLTYDSSNRIIQVART